MCGKVASFLKMCFDVVLIDAGRGHDTKISADSN